MISYSPSKSTTKLTNTRPPSISYALTLRILLANLRRKLGISTIAPVPQSAMSLPAGAENILIPPSYVDPTTAPAPMTMEELGFAWPSERGIFSPSAIPTWLQEGVSIFFLSREVFLKNEVDVIFRRMI